MTFFQNPFTAEFRGNWVLGDRKLILTFDCPPNAGRGSQIVQSYGAPPFNLSGNDSDGNPTNILNISFALDNNDFRNWASIAVDLTASPGTIAAAVTINKAVESLNLDTVFSAYFTASQQDNRILITQKLPDTRFRFYICNTQGETVLSFNKFAGVSELPTYFSRHSVANRFNFSDGTNCLIELDPVANNVDGAVIDNAVDVKGISKGYDSTNVSEDWELLRGRSGIFTFRKTTVDVNDRPRTVIEYSAGSVVGDLAKKITYTYTGVNKTPDTLAEVPYILVTADLITP